MAIDIFYGVDGTGPSQNDLYFHEFSNSFVQRFFREWGDLDMAGYARGPAGLDWNADSKINTKTLGDNAYEFIARRWQAFKASQQNPRIFLSGYSRGGAAVLHAAQRLQQDNIPVYCMLLFDAVDRSRHVRVSGIPVNVENTFHAMCAALTRSRYYFSNVGTYLEVSPKAETIDAFHIHQSVTTPRLLEVKQFFCTHGGIGGNPWPKPPEAKPSEFIREPLPQLPDTQTYVSYAQEHLESRSAGDWMASNLSRMRGASERKVRQGPLRYRTN